MLDVFAACNRNNSIPPIIWATPVRGHNPIASLGHYLFYTADDFSSVDVSGLKPW